MISRRSSAIDNPVLLLLSLVTIILGVRLHLIDLYSSHIPYWDDWAFGTFLTLYAEGKIELSNMFTVANEHRGFFLKVVAISLFDLNSQQWDPRLTMIASAIIYAITGGILISVALKSRDVIRSSALIGFVLLLMVYPLSIFNVLSTVQTYIYFMILFVVAGSWLSSGRPLTIWWSVGMFCLFAACLTAGGGAFAPIAVALVSWCYVFFDQLNRKRYLITALSTSLLSVFGASLILTQDKALRLAQSLNIEAFLTTFFKVLSWPDSTRTLTSIFFIAPILILFIQLVRKPQAGSRIGFFALSLAAFGGAMAISIAYARGWNSGAAPAGRYFDFLALYSIASITSLLILQNVKIRLTKKANLILVFSWSLAFISAVPYQLKVLEFNTNDRETLRPIQESLVSSYIITEDPDFFADRAPREVPFPRPDTLMELIGNMKKIDTLPYQLQTSADPLRVDKDQTWIKNGSPQPAKNRYRAYENFIGSFSLQRGGQHAIGEYSSQVYQPSRPYVMIPHIGYLGYEGMSIKLVGETSGKETIIVSRELSSTYAEYWREEIVASPGEPFRIVASDQNDELWLAIASPRSVGRMTYYAEKFLRKGNSIWKYGLLLLLILMRNDIVRLFRLPQEKGSESTHQT